jgi:hypothetical protein
VNCSLSINGPDHICNVESAAAYSLSSPVPNYSTIVWSVDDPTDAHVSTYADDWSKVTLLKKGSDANANITLKATLSGCTNVITKQIIVGAPAPGLEQSFQCPSVGGYVITPDAISWTWTLMDQFTSQETVTVSTTAGPGPGYNGMWWNISDGDYYIFNVSYTNVCGTSPRTWSQSYWCDPNADDAIASPGLKVYPNPSNGVVTVTLPAGTLVTSKVPTGTAPTSTARALTKTGPAAARPVSNPKIYQLRVTDAMGVVRKTFQYPAGVREASVDLGGLASGVYILQVYDNKTWTSRQVVLKK